MIRVTGIVGGIGAGKSMVSRILVAMGYEVYDCDSRAKEIMDSSGAIHEELCRRIHPRAVVEGVIDRGIIAEVVFADAERLSDLNDIVHRHVKADLQKWIDSRKGERCFVETAIPGSSHLDLMLTDAWIVTADDDVRITRVVERSHLSPKQIMSRIASQAAETENLQCPSVVIRNNPDSSLLTQINSLLKALT